MNPAATARVAVSLTAITVSDLAAAAEFYVEGCGFDRSRDISTAEVDVVIVKAGEAGIQLVRPHAGGGPVDHGNALVKLVIAAGDVDGLVTRAVAHGGTIVAPPAVNEAFGGVMIAMLRDPDGYLVEVVERASLAAANTA